jgi:ABC-type multidrug transport system fused ATPase/permease subunit
MDEATSAVDQATDESIHRLLRAHFNHCTILTIAHRLKTIMASDRVLVMEQGQVKEFASPTQLSRDPESAFARLLAELPRTRK